MKAGDVLICKVGCAGPEVSFEEGVEYLVTAKNIELMEDLVKAGYMALPKATSLEEESSAQVDSEKQTPIQPRRSRK